MKTFYYVFQTLRRGRGGNVLKVISLGLGLTMSVLLFSRVAYEQSFDTCFEEYDRLYQVWSVFTVNGERFEPQEQNCGPVAGAILENFPDAVEAATSVCLYSATQPVYNGNVRFTDRKVMADSLFFRTMGIEVLSGDPVKELQQKDVIFLSRDLADRMFGGENPVGKVISYNHEIDLTVKGIYADLPDNATMHPQAVISLPTMWTRGWGNYSWRGGDSYPEYVRLKPGADADAINARMDAMIAKYRPEEDKKAFGYEAFIVPIRDTYRGYDSVQRMRNIMLTLGLAMLFVAGLNYVLISISSLSRRAKAVGVHKCNGAGSGTVFAMFLLETGVILLLAVALMLALLYAFRDFVEDTAATSLANLFAPERLWVPAGTVLLLFLIGAVLPGRMFARIPVTQVFCRYTEGKKGWKRPLLFVQFAGVAFICGLMCLVMAQYHYVITRDMGFSTDRMVACYLGLSNEEADRAYTFFRGLPYVEELTAAGSHPLWGYSGMMVDDEAGQPLFSTRFDYVMENYPTVMGMTMLQGRAPRQSDEVIVNETYAELMHWGSQVVGRTVGGEGARYKVVGLLKDFNIEGFYNEPMPFIGTYRRHFSGALTLRLKEPFGENLVKLNRDAAEAFPTKMVDFQSSHRQMEELYNPVRVFRNATMVAGVVMFFVMLMGLLGYTADEVQRRSKEIAVRKVNGAEATDILSLLSRDVLYVALPAVIVGILASWYVNGLWMEQFAQRVEMNPALYIIIGIAVLALIWACVVGKAWRIANENPVVSLKTE